MSSEEDGGGAVDSRGRAETPIMKTMVTARRIMMFAFLVYALTGGGRIVGSDGTTMLDLARAMLRGRISVPEGATLPGRGGLNYTKNTAGQALISLPLVAVGEAAASIARLDEGRRRLAVRFVASFFNAGVTALLLGLFFMVVRMFGATPGAALAATLMLGFTTPLWPYAKSFMAEPLQAIGLLAVVLGAAAASRLERGEGIAAGGLFLAVFVKLSMLPIALVGLLPMLGLKWRRWLWPLWGLVTALAYHALYNLLRFGTPLETGYGVQASTAGFSTPLLVGLYGLLLSSGKGVLWFAPVVWLVPAGWRALRRDAAAAPVPGAPAEIWRRAGWGAAACSVVGLLMYARFQHWAGDGSFGPRYLVPLLPLVFLIVAAALSHASAWRRRAAWALALAGLFVQIGGVSIYFGAQMREAGDYPYTLPLDDPRFMSDSHFNPAFSPIVGHWRMLLRNAGEHLHGDMPRIDLATPGGMPATRLGVSDADQSRLLHALDFWWLYLVYAGLPALPVWLIAAGLAALAVWTARRLGAAYRTEARAP